MTTANSPRATGTARTHGRWPSGLGFFFFFLRSPRRDLAASLSAASTGADPTGRSTRRAFATSAPTDCWACTFSSISASIRPTVAASRGRFALSFSSRNMIRLSNQMGKSGTSLRGRTGVSPTCFMNMSMVLSPTNGFLPVTSSYRQMPSEYRSDFGPRVLSPRHCSGDMYAAVPIVLLAPVRAVTSVSLAMPKSVSLSTPWRLTMRFDGFKSRWTMPLSWACWRASHSCLPYCTTSSQARDWRRASTLSRDSPSTYSIAMNGVLRYLPTASRRTMCGCLSCLRIAASRSNRAIAPSFPSRPIETILIATGMVAPPSLAYLALYTVPMAPLPSSFSTVNGPMVSPTSIAVS